MADPKVRTAYEVLEVRDDASHTVIDAAFRALASRYHPDRNPSAAAERRMVELNRAYALVRTSDLRAVYDRLHPPVNPDQSAAQPTPAPARASARPPARKDVLDFGRYEGASLAEIARHDPDYLRWLSRHSSGIRYRQRINELLANPQPQPASERMGKRARGR
jgi:curved DNA-binding protein CbpA